jgi:hypothetical protein
MPRPARLELATPCLEAVRTTLPNLARGVANRADSASRVRLADLPDRDFWRLSVISATTRSTSK